MTSRSKQVLEYVKQYFIVVCRKKMAKALAKAERMTDFRYEVYYFLNFCDFNISIFFVVTI